METLLQMRQINKEFPGVKALEDVDFTVDYGEVHCLIGANGAGKSTLMKILSGAYTQDSGEIFFAGEKLKKHDTQSRKKAGISIIYQELSLFNELTVAENVFINNCFKKKGGAVDWKTTFKKTQELADSLNIAVDAKAKVSSLNIGQRQLTEIMKALASDAKLIVMDEPSSTLSQTEFEILVNVIKDLKSKGVAIVYISHHLEELFVVGDKITVLKDGKFVACNKASDITEQDLVDQMVGKRHIKEVDASHSRDVEHREVVLELKGMSNHKVSDVNLKLHKGEIVGIYGLVGSGRTEILQSIYGVVPPSEGEIFLNGKKTNISNTQVAIKHRIGLAPESRKTQGLVLPLKVWENMSMAAIKKYKKNGIISYKEIAKVCNEYVDKLSVKTPSIYTVTNNLSGGNQQKVILAKWLMDDCDILLLDEPTQGIDVIAKEEIYNLIIELTEQGKSVIIVSSELQEILEICDVIHVMYDGRQIMETKRGEFSSDTILHTSVMGRIAT